MSDAQLRYAATYEVFNLVASESVLLLDCSTSTGGPLLQGSTVLDQSLPPPEAARLAQQENLDRYGPETPSIAVVIDDAVEGKGAEVSEWLLREGGCRRVLRASRTKLLDTYPFLFQSDISFTYPQEILEGKLYLGSLAAVKPSILDALHITHIVSIIDWPAPSACGRVHLWCSIPDSDSAELEPVLREALPFIDDAIAGGGIGPLPAGRFAVCERGHCARDAGAQAVVQRCADARDVPA